MNVVVLAELAVGVVVCEGVIVAVAVGEGPTVLVGVRVGVFGGSTVLVEVGDAVEPLAPRASTN